MLNTSAMEQEVSFAKDEHDANVTKQSILNEIQNRDSFGAG